MRCACLVALAAGAVVLWGAGPLAAAPPTADPPRFTAEQLEFFESKVRPILANRCQKCHGPKQQKGGLRLDSRAAVLAGGDTGAAITPGKPDTSLLIDAVRYGEVYQMPPTGKLPDEEIALLVRWVEQGAPWPDDGAAAPADPARPFDLQARRAEHWCWQPVQDPAPPAVRDEAWPRDSLDRFILARLEEAGLQPAEAADRRTLCRRLYFDLIGLPPSPDEVEAFVQDPSSEAVARLVDRLLDSPHFGERWGRHWLDLVRYAESRGHEFDYDLPNAWQYRDYVIRAFNADVPYNQLVIEHVAGDLLPDPRRHPAEGFNESVLGTGFWFLGEWVHSPVDVRLDELERFDNALDVFSKAFLGLTISCARCHDHKFDAISQRDYYALLGFLQSSGYRQVCFDTLDEHRRIAEALEASQAEHRPAIAGALAAGLRQPAGETARYLLAAAEGFSLLPPASEKDEPNIDDATGDGNQAKRTQALDTLAARHEVGSPRLAAWIGELHTARADGEHPLHAFAVAAAAHQRDAPPQATQAAVQGVLQTWRQQQAAAWPAEAEIVVDYARCPPEQFIQDGSSFGPRPLAEGDLLWNDDPRRPVLGVVWQPSARRDPLFKGLALAAGTQNDPGRLSGYIRGGQTLRTPSFVLKRRAVYYLVEGAGHAHAAVASHHMINGPLHGELVRTWDAAPGWQWVEHRLDRHTGQRLVVQLTPKDAQADLAVRMVVQADGRPPQPPVPRTRLLAAVEGADTLAALAEAHQSLCAAALDGLAEGKPDAELARVADWMLRRDALFPLSEAAANALQSAAEPLIEHRRKLAGQVRKTSRLAPAMIDGTAADERLLIRGNHKTPADVVPRRLPEALLTGPAPDYGPRSGRLRLAEQLVDPQNPLVARVMVNRVWHHLLGRGIVPSVDNFGVLGQRPTHPQLLDHLAVGFVRDGWSVKRLIRRIVLSATYQMSSTATAGDQADPQNRLLHRANIKRLEAEAIRDSVLALGGRLDRTLFGPSVPVYLTPFMTGRGAPPGGPLDGNGRRTIYLSVRRNFLSSTLLAFDFPIPFTTRGQRTVSNVPAQALILMNDPLVLEQTQRWARQSLQAPLSSEQRVRQLYLAALARPPQPAELAAALEFLNQQAQEYGLAPEALTGDPRPWADLCHVLLNVKEFIFIP